LTWSYVSNALAAVLFGLLSCVLTFDEEEQESKKSKSNAENFLGGRAPARSEPDDVAE
jgi:hypothetical protein